MSKEAEEIIGRAITGIVIGRGIAWAGFWIGFFYFLAHTVTT